MAGTKVNAFPVRAVVNGYKVAAVAANDVLGMHVVCFPAKITAIQANAETAGTGGGNTVLDVLVNGTSMYATAGNKPTLAATSIGAFTIGNEKRTVLPGDVIKLVCASISSTGHAIVSMSAVLELI